MRVSIARDRNEAIVEHTDTITGISSMATRRLFGELVPRFERNAGLKVTIQSVGGVDAARRVRDGEPVDLIVLASNVIEQLEAEGVVVVGTRTDLACSGVAVAVRTGTPHPDISDEDAVRRAVLAGGTICYSSGPSGNHLKGLFERWGIAGEIASRTVEAKPGVPVAGLVAQGTADFGFQQQSELLDVPGIDIVGPLPPAIQTITTFTAGVARAATNPDGARAFIAFLASPETASVKRALGLEAPPRS
jgi:molybdate transport system substrate-binding protein